MYRLVKSFEDCQLEFEFVLASRHKSSCQPPPFAALVCAMAVRVAPRLTH